MRRKRWIKLWTQEALAGTTRKEMEPDERSVWWDFLALAGDSLDPGKICFYPGVPLTDGQLCRALNITQELLDRARNKMLEYEKISIDDGIIYITNWGHYQAPYERVKAWREHQREDTTNVSNETKSSLLQMKPEMISEDQSRGRPEEDNNRTEKEDKGSSSSSSLELIVSKMLSNCGQEIGGLTPKISKQIEDYASVFALSEAPIEWIDEAFKEAATYNKRSWSYVKKILQTWIRHGKGGISADSAKYIRGKYGPLVKR